MNRPFPIQPASMKRFGQDFVRAAIATAASGRGNAAGFAARRWGEDSESVRILKSPVGAGATAGEGADMIAPSGASIEFMGAVYERSAVGKLLLRRRPARTRYLVNTGTAKGSWVGEGKSIPVLPFTFDEGSIGLKKVAAIIVQTKELLESADPAAEQGIRNDLLNGLAEAIDVAFFDPNNAGDDATPASVTNGLTPVSVGTGDLDDTRAALSTMIAEFEGDLSRAVFVARPELYAMLNGLGYRDIGIRGGTLVGAPAIATKGLPATNDLYQLLLIDPDGIAFADDPGATQVSSSSNAALQMDSAPTNDAVTPTPTNLVSCYQTNAVATKVLAYANWSVERAGSVAMMTALPVAAVS